MDYLILANAILSFIAFMIIHLLVFRKIDHEKVIKFLPRVFAAGILISMIISFLIIYINPTSNSSLTVTFILLCLVSIVLYGLLVFIYILGVFGLVVSAIRIRLLCDIAARKDVGIKESELLTKYNPETILDIRLERLLKSGVLVCLQNQYELKKGFTPFYLHVCTVIFLRKIYTGK